MFDEILCHVATELVSMLNLMLFCDAREISTIVVVEFPLISEACIIIFCIMLIYGRNFVVFVVKVYCC